jgi:hypothetical protein
VGIWNCYSFYSYNAVKVSDFQVTLLQCINSVYNKNSVYHILCLFYLTFIFQLEEKKPRGLQLVISNWLKSLCFHGEY